MLCPLFYFDNCTLENDDISQLSGAVFGCSVKHVLNVVVFNKNTLLCLQVCSRCVCLQLRWIPSIVRESLCHLKISWTRPGSPCLGIYTVNCAANSAVLHNTVNT